MSGLSIPLVPLQRRGARPLFQEQWRRNPTWLVTKLYLDSGQDGHIPILQTGKLRSRAGLSHEHIGRDTDDDDDGDVRLRLDSGMYLGSVGCNIYPSWRTSCLFCTC